MKLFDLGEFEAMMEAQRRRERWYKPGFWMLRVLKRKTGEARRHVRWAYQRVVRGWDDRAVWAVDDHLSKTLGEQLVTMSEIAHGYPGESYPFEQWTSDLKRHGEALKAYHNLNYDVHGDEWIAIYDPAREALRWVADNLASLWD